MSGVTVNAAAVMIVLVSLVKRGALRRVDVGGVPVVQPSPGARWSTVHSWYAGLRGFRGVVNLIMPLEAGAADRPGGWPLAGEDVLGDPDLFGFRCSSRVPGSAVGAPCGFGELQPTVEPVAGVGGPVSAALALRDRIPIVAGGGNRMLSWDRGSGCRSGGTCETERNSEQYSGSGDRTEGSAY